MKTPPLEVVCALIINKNGQLLACRRGPHSSLPGKWEFPGGKIEIDETPEAALKREIHEELDISISIQTVLDTVTHHYPDFTIALSPFLCQIKDSQSPKCIEHAELRWINPSEANSLDWAEADLPIIEQYKKLL